MLAFEFPPINEVLRWRDLFPTFNKIALIAVAAALIGSLIYYLAGRKDPMVAPRGVRNFAESTVEFIENGVVMQTMGRSGLPWTPFLLTLFVFIYLCNVPGIIPLIQMPATGRFAIPFFLSMLVLVVFVGAGFKHHKLGYLKEVLFPPGIPKALYLLVTPIELISTFIVRPFSLMVRLFANMMAGHMLLVTFALLSEAMFQARTNQFILVPLGIMPFFMLMFVVAFEILVAFLQAYIFVVLTSVYIGGAVHPDH